MPIQATTLTPKPALLQTRAAGLWRAGLGRMLALAAATVAGAVGATEAPAVLTLLEGEASLIVGARAYAAAPGARVPAGALVETGAGAGLLRLEWADGAMLDLGPGTKVMLRPTLSPAGGSTGRPAPLFYLLQGWAKQTQPTAGGGQIAAAFEIAPFKGVMLSHVGAEQVVLFSEAGGESFTPRRAGARVVALRAGEAAVLSGTAEPQLLPRPAPAWLQQLPRAFRETLPSRAAQFAASTPPALPAQRAPTYGQLQPWLQAEPALRRAFPARFAELLADRTFKDAVNTRLKQHPEWEPVLRPPPRPGAASRKINAPAEPEPSR